MTVAVAWADAALPAVLLVVLLVLRERSFRSSVVAGGSASSPLPATTDTPQQEEGD